MATIVSFEQIKRARGNGLSERRQPLEVTSLNIIPQNSRFRTVIASFSGTNKEFKQYLKAMQEVWGNAAKRK